MRKIALTGLAVLAMAALGDRVQAQPPGGGAGGPPNMMQFLDTDKDGKISLAEYTTMAERRWERISQGADKVKAANLQGMQANAVAGITPDADGNVTKSAYLAAVPTRFKAADSNGDGFLDQNELMTAMPMMRRGGGGGGGN